MSYPIPPLGRRVSVTANEDKGSDLQTDLHKQTTSRKRKNKVSRSPTVSRVKTFRVIWCTIHETRNETETDSSSRTTTNTPRRQTKTHAKRKTPQTRNSSSRSSTRCTDKQNPINCCETVAKKLGVYLIRKGQHPDTGKPHHSHGLSELCHALGGL